MGMADVDYTTVCSADVPDSSPRKGKSILKVLIYKCKS